MAFLKIDMKSGINLHNNILTNLKFSAGTPRAFKNNGENKIPDDELALRPLSTSRTRRLQTDTIPPNPEPDTQEMDMIIIAIVKNPKIDKKEEIPFTELHTRLLRIQTAVETKTNLSEYLNTHLDCNEFAKKLMKNTVISGLSVKILKHKCTTTLWHVPTYLDYKDLTIFTKMLAKRMPTKLEIQAIQTPSPREILTALGYKNLPSG